MASSIAVGAIPEILIAWILCVVFSGLLQGVRKRGSASLSCWVGRPEGNDGILYSSWCYPGNLSRLLFHVFHWRQYDFRSDSLRKKSSWEIGCLLDSKLILGS